MTTSIQCQSSGGATWVAVSQRPSVEAFRPMQASKWLISILLLIGVIFFVGRNYNFSGFVDDARKISLPVLTLVLLSLLGNALAASLRFKVVAMRIGHRVTFRQAMAAVSAGSLFGAIFFQIAGQLIGRSFVMARTAVPF